jgi:DNA gyrase inhibitor GyrI
MAEGVRPLASCQQQNVRDRLYRNWLPHSGAELREFPVYFHYLNLRVNTPEHELLTDVHLPLK